MKANPVLFPVLFALLALALYAGVEDQEALLLLVINGLLTAPLLVAGIASGNLALLTFVALFGISFAISPTFFFLNRDQYTYSGWTAVGSFHFDLGEFLSIYIWPYLFMYLVLAVAIFTRSIVPRAPAGPAPEASPELDTSPAGPDTPPRDLTWFLYAFLAAMAPFLVYMHQLGVGIVGLIPTELPFKLTGAFYYFRGLISPLLVFYLYGHARRTRLLAVVVMAFAILAGTGAASRSVLAMFMMPVLFYAYLDRQYVRLGASIFLLAIGYTLVSQMRGTLYDLGPTTLLAAILSTDLIENMDLFAAGFYLEFITGITQRLGSAQEIVLCHQYHLEDQALGIWNFATGNPVVENMALDIFKMYLPEDKAFGVGFALVPMAMLLANEDPVIFLCICVVVALTLNLSERLRLGLQNHGTKSLRAAAMPLLIISVFLLFSARILQFYAFLLLFYIATRWFRESPPQRPTPLPAPAAGAPEPS